MANSHDINEPVAYDWDTIHQVLCEVWNRDSSADEGLEAIQDLIYSEPTIEAKEPVARVPAHPEQKPVAIIEKESGFETVLYATGYADSLPDGVFKLYAAPIEPMEQKPVAWLSEGGDVSRSKKFFDDMGLKSSPLYAAPVRTKDLTDDEISSIRNLYASDLYFARAVIAADREKNR